MSSIALTWPNLKEASEGVFSAGKPEEVHIGEATKAGIKAIVNLCDTSELGWDESAKVREQGMRYEHIPVRGPTDVCEANARKLHELLNDDSLHPMIIHCGSGNRVGALVALREFHCCDADAETAVAKGHEAGLLGLEPHVRKCLGC